MRNGLQGMEEEESDGSGEGHQLCWGSLVLSVGRECIYIRFYGRGKWDGMHDRRDGEVKGKDDLACLTPKYFIFFQV